MGLSWHTSKAILEGFRGKKSSFVRTPKFNIMQKVNDVPANTIAARGKPGTLWMEGVLAIYFLAAVGAACIREDYSFLVYHLMLVIGFGSIFIFTLLHHYRN
jgi:hypothetical protein